jgi:hypothetical protein
MTLQSTNGQILAFRKRAIGTGEMVSTLANATTDSLGYAFWSVGNFTTNLTSTPPVNIANLKYLTVNGIDPLKNAYTDGVLPAGNDTGTGHQPSDVTFKWLNQGDYPIWSALRIVSKNPTPAGVTSLIAGAQTLDSAQHDFITLANLTVVHSHFYLPAINFGIEGNGDTLGSTGDLCSVGTLGEQGGDAGGANVPKQVNSHFCTDFNNPNGLINKTN